MTRSTTAIVAVYIYALIISVESQLVITRNAQDCVFPVVAANQLRLWPTSLYLPKGMGTKAMRGGFKIDTAGFTIEYYSTYKVVTNKIANEKYLLYHCGTTSPAVSGVDKAFQIPLTSVSVNDASAADYMTQIVLMDRCAFSGELSVSGCLQKLAACGYVAPEAFAGDDGPLKNLAGRVDAFWTYAAYPNQQTIAFNAVNGQTPLERATWLAYTAAFFNKEWQAGEMYIKIRDTYNQLSRQAKTLAADTGYCPKVCWVTKDYQGAYAMSYAQYKVAYIKDAGGCMLDPSELILAGMEAKPPGSTTGYAYKPTTQDLSAKFGGVLYLCDIIIDESYEMSTGGLTEMSSQNPDGFMENYGFPAEYASQIKAIQNLQVYTLAGTTGQTITAISSSYKGSVGLDWFERAVSRADEVIQDMIKVIQPNVDDDLIRSRSLRWLLRLDGRQQQQKVPAVCDLSTAKLDAFCRRTSYAARICPNVVRNCDSGKLEYPSNSKRCTAVSAQASARRARKKQGLAECA